MEVPERIAIDANCVTYLLDALEGVVEPTDSLANQRKALVRLFFYSPGALIVTPTICREVSAIPDSERRKRHKTCLSVLFEPVFPASRSRVIELSCVYHTVHSRDGDCRALAESVEAGCDAFLSFDRAFVRNLQAYAVPLRLEQPADYWHSLAIPQGTRPRSIPAPSNPLAQHNWWSW
jgi:hypothetical protein